MQIQCRVIFLIFSNAKNACLREGISIEVHLNTVFAVAKLHPFQMSDAIGDLVSDCKKQNKANSDPNRYKQGAGPAGPNAQIQQVASPEVNRSKHACQTDVYQEPEEFLLTDRRLEPTLHFVTFGHFTCLKSSRGIDVNGGSALVSRKQKGPLMAQRVLVTGATGFIASHTVLSLLEKGYDVRGTARSADKAEKLNATLSAYAETEVNIPIVAANLTADEGWAEAVEGCDYVCHVASPVPANLPKNLDDLLIPARDGALRVLKASKAAGVKRVVMTSSIAAVGYGHGNNTPVPLTEELWTNPDNIKDNTVYTQSKTYAERAAWDYVTGEGQGLELATVNPVAVLGPVMSGDFSASLEIILQLMGGKLPATPKFGFSIVDVRDVADLHVLALEQPEAAGERYIASEGFMMFKDMGVLLGEHFPDYSKKLPKGELPDWLLKVSSLFNPVLKQVMPELGKRREASFEKAVSQLGWQPRTAEEAVLSAARSLMKHGVI